MPETINTLSTEAENPGANAQRIIPRESLCRLFARFLRFGGLAWGGPVAQIGMLRHSLVDEERWVTPEHFNRVLALYQVLPGPEAHELCVYFGTLVRGRLGGIVAGLGFMLPGFCLMFLLSWLYVRYGLDLHGPLSTVFLAVQAAVIALIVRAVHRIGSHVLHDRWLGCIALLALGGHLLGIHFAVLLAVGGGAYTLAKTSAPLGAAICVASALAMIGWFVAEGLLASSPLLQSSITALSPGESSTASVSALLLFWSGLKVGLLTFGGAYTAIPLLQRDAVNDGAWMTNAQFMDGIALGGLLPAPLIIFGTFVGYIGGGPPGAIAMTVGIFLPAFAMTLIAHEPLERLISDRRVRVFLDGLSAAVVGLIAATTIALFVASIRSAFAGAVFIVAALALFRWNHKLLIPAVLAFAAVAGAIATAFT